MHLDHVHFMAEIWKQINDKNYYTLLNIFQMFKSSLEVFDWSARYFQIVSYGGEVTAGRCLQTVVDVEFAFITVGLAIGPTQRGIIHGTKQRASTLTFNVEAI